MSPPRALALSGNSDIQQEGRKEAGRSRSEESFEPQRNIETFAQITKYLGVFHKWKAVCMCSVSIMFALGQILDTIFTQKCPSLVGTVGWGVVLLEENLTCSQQFFEEDLDADC